MKLTLHYDDSVTILVEEGKRSLTVSLKELTELRQQATDLLKERIKARAEELLNQTYVGQNHHHKSTTRTSYTQAYEELAKLEIGGAIQVTITGDEAIEYRPDDIHFSGTSNAAQGETDGKEGKVTQV